MAVERYDLDSCIGCRRCVELCPMDVFRFDEENMKSIIAYPENCQGCAMCYMSCPGQSLQITLHNHYYPTICMDALHGVDVNHFVWAAPNVHNAVERITKTGDYASEPDNSTELDTEESSSSSSSITGVTVSS